MRIELKHQLLLIICDRVELETSLVSVACSLYYLTTCELYDRIDLEASLVSVVSKIYRFLITIT